MSYESERLEKLIAYKKSQLPNIKIEKFKSIMSAEIIFLEKQVLPLLSSNTDLSYSNVAKYAVNAVKFGERNKLNGVLFFLPISDEYENNPKIGIANSKSMLDYRSVGSTNVFVKEIEIINMDGNMAKYAPLNMPIDELI